MGTAPLWEEEIICFILIIRIVMKQRLFNGVTAASRRWFVSNRRLGSETRIDQLGDSIRITPARPALNSAPVSAQFSPV